MPQYYYVVNKQLSESTIRRGIQCRHDPLITRTPCAYLFSDNYISLWKNLQIFFPAFIKTGLYELLSVEIPATHPLERNLGLSASLCGDSEKLADLLYQLQLLASIDPRPFIDADKIKKFVTTLRDLQTEQEKTQKFVKWTLEQFAQDEGTIKTILKQATDDNWDRVIGAYLTKQEIPPNTPYRIQRHHL